MANSQFPRPSYQSFEQPQTQVVDQVAGLSEPLPRETSRKSLGPGVREAIALALELKASLLILDDDPARRVAMDLGITTMGKVGVLLRAKDRQLIKSIKPHLDALLSNRFFLTPELYHLILSRAGEV